MHEEALVDNEYAPSCVNEVVPRENTAQHSRDDPVSVTSPIVVDGSEDIFTSGKGSVLVGRYSSSEFTIASQQVVDNTVIEAEVNVEEDSGFACAHVTPMPKVVRQPDVVALSSVVAVDSRKQPVSSTLGIKDSLQPLSHSGGQEDLGIQIALSYDSRALLKYSKSPSSFEAGIHLGSEDSKLPVFDQTPDPLAGSASTASKVIELPVFYQTPKTSMCIFWLFITCILFMLWFFHNVFHSLFLLVTCHF
jgi:hypothetical protein